MVVVPSSSFWTAVVARERKELVLLLVVLASCACPGSGAEEGRRAIPVALLFGEEESRTEKNGVLPRPTIHNVIDAGVYGGVFSRGS